MKRLIFVLAATAIGVVMGPAAAMTIPAAASPAATTTAIALKPPAGPPTTTVRVNGTGFGPGETVSVDFGTTLAATATTSSAGSFTTSLQVPAAALPRRHAVTATGQSSGLSATAFFWVRTNWAKFHFDNGNSGFNPYENVLSPANVAGLRKVWSHQTSSGYSSPAVANGVVYVGSTPGLVYALNAATGAQLWSYLISGAYVSSSPAVRNGAVYVDSYDGKLYKFHL